MAKIAKLVCISLTVRVLVDESETDEKTMEVAMPHLRQKLNVDGILDNIERIEKDMECPFGTFDTDK